jgi:hypothetical protein
MAKKTSARTAAMQPVDVPKMMTAAMATKVDFARITGGFSKGTGRSIGEQKRGGDVQEVHLHAAGQETQHRAATAKRREPIRTNLHPISPAHVGGVIKN